MKRMVATLVAVAVMLPAVAFGQMVKPRAFMGVDVGASIPLNDNYWAHAHTGGIVSPYVGYMMDEAFGIQANLHGAVQPADDDDRGFADEEDLTTVLGATVGPRLSLPFGKTVEVYFTGQGGVFGGVSGRLDNEFDGGVSLGGGIDYFVSPRVAISAFGRWNWASIEPSPDLRGFDDSFFPQDPEDSEPDDIKWATAGIGIKYDLRPLPKKRAPKPAPIAKKAPEPAPLPKPTKKKLVLRGVNFDFDKANIRADAAPILDKAAAALSDQADVKVVVAGHTDSKGSETYNQGLSERRAKAVKGYLVKKGVASNRLTVVGHGELKPVADNSTKEGRAQNRRVVLQVNQ